jgi:uncharacterized membrane protein YdbT with pleckstrin-like domain
MEPLGIFVGAVMSAVLVAVAAYFALQQHATLQSVRYDNKLSTEHRLYLIKRCYRRTFGSLLLLLLAGLMIGSLFLDLTPGQHANEAEAREAARFLGLYFASMMLVVVLLIVVAVLDSWATAKHGFRQQKQLLQEHREMLEAELLEHRHRQTDLN